MSTADERPRSEATEASEGMTAQGMTPPPRLRRVYGSIDLRKECGYVYHRGSLCSSKGKGPPQ